MSSPKPGVDGDGGLIVRAICYENELVTVSTGYTLWKFLFKIPAEQLVTNM